MIILYNDYHRTFVRLNGNVGHLLSYGQVTKSRRILCGENECKCSDNVLGTTGPQQVTLRQFAHHTYEVVSTTDRSEFIPDFK